MFLRPLSQLKEEGEDALRRAEEEAAAVAPAGAGWAGGAPQGGRPPTSLAPSWAAGGAAAAAGSQEIGTPAQGVRVFRDRELEVGGGWFVWAWVWCGGSRVLWYELRRRRVVKIVRLDAVFSLCVFRDVLVAALNSTAVAALTCSGDVQQESHRYYSPGRVSRLLRGWVLSFSCCSVLGGLIPPFLYCLLSPMPAHFFQMTLECLCDFMCEPTFLVEVFVNYDCDLQVSLPGKTKLRTRSSVFLSWGVWVEVPFSYFALHRDFRLLLSSTSHTPRCLRLQRALFAFREHYSAYAHVRYTRPGSGRCNTVKKCRESSFKIFD